MKTFNWLILPACAGLGLTAFSQSSPDTDSAPIAPQSGALAPSVLSTPQAALGTLLQGPIDVMNTVTASPSPGTVWNRQLGCGNGWGYYWVSGGAGTTGAFAIHQFNSTTGAYIQSFTQDMSLATGSVWGIRDLAIDEASFKLWGGMEGRVLKEYTFNPGAGPNGTLTYTTTYLLPVGGSFASTATVRALARNPSTGDFYCKNFSTALWRFSIAGGVPVYLGESPANGKATYGLAWDTLNNTLWQFDQFPVSTTDAVEFNEIDTAGVLTGRTFSGTLYGTTGTNIAGGCDFIDDGSGVTKILALHQNTADELNVYELDPTTTPPVVYCTAGTTTNNCFAAISATANPSVSFANGCVINVAAVEGQKSGLVFYSISGQQAATWNGSSFLCVKAPTQRTTTQNSGGNANACDGSMSLDWNAYQTANPTALGNPWAAGNLVQAQAWFRDPPAGKTTNLSDAIELTYQP